MEKSDDILEAAAETEKTCSDTRRSTWQTGASDLDIAEAADFSSLAGRARPIRWGAMSE